MDEFIDRVGAGSPIMTGIILIKLVLKYIYWETVEPIVKVDEQDAFVGEIDPDPGTVPPEHILPISLMENIENMRNFPKETNNIVAQVVFGLGYYFLCAWIIVNYMQHVLPVIWKLEKSVLTSAYLFHHLGIIKRVLVIYCVWLNRMSYMYIIPVALSITLTFYEKWILGAFFTLVTPKYVMNFYTKWEKWFTKLSKNIEEENIREVCNCLEKTWNNNLDSFCFWGPALMDWGKPVSKEQIQVIFRMLCCLKFPNQKLHLEDPNIFTSNTYINSQLYKKMTHFTNFKVPMSATALHISIECGKVEEFRKSLTVTDVDINAMATLRAVKPFPLTPLMFACNSDLKEAEEILEILLKQKEININVITSSKKTALSIAFRKVVENKERLGLLLQLLKDPRTNLDLKLGDSRTFLMKVIQEIDWINFYKDKKIWEEEIREQILHYVIGHPKMNVNVTEKSGRAGNHLTALHQAVIRDQPITVKMLLLHPNIQVNVRANNYDTPLTLAASGNLPNCFEIIKLLVSHRKTDLSAKNSRHYTAVRYAHEHKNAQVLSFLVAAEKLKSCFDLNPKRLVLENNFTTGELMIKATFLKATKDKEFEVRENKEGKEKKEENKKENKERKENEEEKGMLSIATVAEYFMGKENKEEKSTLSKATKANNFEGKERKEEKENKEETQNKEEGNENKERKDNKERKESKEEKIIKCCWSCGQDDIKLYKCGGCKKAFYCSDKCIEEDWKVHGGWCLKRKEKRKNKKSKNSDSE